MAYIIVCYYILLYFVQITNIHILSFVINTKTNNKKEDFYYE